MFPSPGFLSMSFAPVWIAASLIAATVLGIATVTDLRHRKIRNRLTYSAMLIGLLVHSTVGFGVAHGLFGMLGCGLVMLLPYSLSGGGAGDVKLAMAVGAVLGFTATIQAFCLGYMIAGTFVAWRFGVCYTLRRTTHSLDDRDASPDPNAPIPMAGFFAAGMLLLLLTGPLW